MMLSLPYEILTMYLISDIFFITLRQVPKSNTGGPNVNTGSTVDRKLKKNSGNIGSNHLAAIPSRSSSRFVFA